MLNIRTIVKKLNQKRLETFVVSYVLLIILAFSTLTVKAAYIRDESTSLVLANNTSQTIAQSESKESVLDENSNTQTSTENQSDSQTDSQNSSEESGSEDHSNNQPNSSSGSSNDSDNTQPTATPKPTSTPVPTSSQSSATPTPTNTSAPTATPTQAPTSVPTVTPTSEPTPIVSRVTAYVHVATNNGNYAAFNSKVVVKNHATGEILGQGFTNQDGKSPDWYIPKQTEFDIFAYGINSPTTNMCGDVRTGNTGYYGTTQNMSLTLYFPRDGQTTPCIHE